jgi:hypothetical protein
VQRENDALRGVARARAAASARRRAGASGAAGAALQMAGQKITTSAEGRAGIGMQAACLRQCRVLPMRRIADADAHARPSAPPGLDGTEKIRAPVVDSGKNRD